MKFLIIPAFLRSDGLISELYKANVLQLERQKLHGYQDNRNIREIRKQKSLYSCHAQ